MCSTQPSIEFRRFLRLLLNYSSCINVSKQIKLTLFMIELRKTVFPAYLYQVSITTSDIITSVFITYTKIKTEVENFLDNFDK